MNGDTVMMLIIQNKSSVEPMCASNIQYFIKYYWATINLGDDQTVPSVIISGELVILLKYNKYNHPPKKN